MIPANLKGKDLIKYVIANKAAIMHEKKSMPLKYADAVSFDVGYLSVKGDSVTKATAEDMADVDSIRVRVVANTAMWCDSHMDVLLPNSAAKSIRERKGMIPHLHDHIHQLGAKVGDVADIYYMDVPLSELGLAKSGTAQALVFETDIKKAYNPMIFDQYKEKKVNQHSIGLRYIKLELGANDEESESEYKIWQAHIDNVINRDMVEEKGFFWAVGEYMLMENSAVLFGSNALTPTLLTSTVNEPLKGTPTPPQFDIKQAITNLKINL